MLQSRKLPRSLGLLFAAFMTFSANIALAETFYIDGDSGDDSYDGLAETHEGGTRGPKRTWTWISYMSAPDFLSPGDRVLFRRGTTISRDDAGNNFHMSNVQNIYFGAYGDESLPRPILDSRGEVGLHIGYNGPTHDLTFEDLTFTTSLPRPVGSQITAYSPDEPGSAEGVTFRRIEVDVHMSTGVNASDETVTFTANNVTIEDCHIHGGARSGIYVAGRNNVIQRNVIEYGGAVGIKLNDTSTDWGQPTRTVVRRNLIVGAQLGFEFGVCDHNDVYGNLIVMPSLPLGEDKRNFGTQIEGTADHNNFFNNTIVINAADWRHHGLRMYQQAGAGNVVANNIVYLYDSGEDDHLFTQGQDAMMPISANNLYFADGGPVFERDGNLFTSLLDWTATAGGPDVNSLFANPNFVGDASSVDPISMPEGFALSDGSPAINTGKVVEMYTELPYEDFLGNPYVGTPDIGAFEFGAAAACDGERCAPGQTCVGGTFNGLCCTGGACGGDVDAGPGVDGGATVDGGPTVDGSAGSDAGTGASGEVDGGCSCSASRPETSHSSRGPALYWLLGLGVLTWRVGRNRRRF